MAPTNRRQVIREASEAQAAPDQHRLEGKLIGPKAGLQQPTVYRIKVERYKTIVYASASADHFVRPAIAR